MVYQHLSMKLGVLEVWNEADDLPPLQHQQDFDWDSGDF